LAGVLNLVRQEKLGVPAGESSVRVRGSARPSAAGTASTASSLIQSCRSPSAA